MTKFVWLLTKTWGLTCAPQEKNCPPWQALCSQTSTHMLQGCVLVVFGLLVVEFISSVANDYLTTNGELLGILLTFLCKYY